MSKFTKLTEEQLKGISYTIRIEMESPFKIGNGALQRPYRLFFCY